MAMIVEFPLRGVAACGAMGWIGDRYEFLGQYDVVDDEFFQEWCRQNERLNQ
jgi:hypothetical protein